MSDFMECEINGCSNVAGDTYGPENRKLCDTCSKAFAYGRLAVKDEVEDW